MDRISKTHWTHECRRRTLESVNTDLKTLERTTTTATTAAAATTTTPTRTGWLASLRRAVRARRANRSDLSREIAAYPAMRSASATALRTARTTR